MKSICIALLLMSLPSLADLRQFTNAKGEKIMAELVSATDTRAELKRADGKAFTVPLQSLSEADRAWIAEWRKTHQHFKIAVQASIKKANTTEKPGTFEGRKIKGNDCWYVLSFQNKSGDALNGLRVDYTIFAPSGGSLSGSADVAAIASGKTGQAGTEKLFVEQAQTVIRSGNSSAVQFSESSLSGIRAELFVDGKPAGVFVSGKVPEDAAAKLEAWRSAQPAKEPKEKPRAGE